MTKSTPTVREDINRRVSMFAALIVIAVAGLVFVGWLVGIDGLRTFVSGQVSMKANTAMCFIIAGGALLAVRGAPSALQTWARWSLSIVLLTFCTLTLAQYFWALDFGIDQWLAVAPRDGIQTTSPGRMAPTTAMGFIFFACAILVDHWRTGVARGLSRTIATMLFLLGLASLLGYAYGAPALYLGFDGVTAMSLPSSILFILLAAGVIWLRFEYGFTAMMAEESVIGAQIRALVPMVVGPPLLVGAAVAAGYGRIYDGQFAIALTSLGSMIAAALVGALGLVLLRRSDTELVVKDRTLAAARNGIFVTDFRAPDNPLVFVNPAFELITGYSAATCVGRNGRFLMSGTDNEPDVVENVSHCIATGARGTFELRLRRSDDEVFWARASFAPVENYEGTITHMVSVIDDVTERRAQDQRVLDALEEAKSANDMRNTFVRLVSHELRTPLNAALTWIRLMEVDDSEETLTRGMEVVAQSIESQSRLIDDLVDVTRFAAAGVSLESEAVDVQELVHATVEELRPLLEEKHRLVLTIEAGDYQAILDPLRLQQILRNLLTNAGKYTPEGGLVEVGLLVKNEQLNLTVSDTGRGLSPKQIERMFEPFWRANTNQNGLGVGLSIVASLVAAHDGTILVTSAGKDQGSSFLVRIPVHAAPSGHTSLHEVADNN